MTAGDTGVMPSVVSYFTLTLFFRVVSSSAGDSSLLGISSSSILLSFTFPDHSLPSSPSSTPEQTSVIYTWWTKV